MAATTVFTGSLAVGANSGPQVLALTAPFRGVELTLFVQTAGKNGGVIPEVRVDYSISIDGGTTYSDPQLCSLENEFSSTGNEDTAVILRDQFATHVKFTLYNQDPLNVITSAVLTAQQFS